MTFAAWKKEAANELPSSLEAEHIKPDEEENEPKTLSFVDYYATCGVPPENVEVPDVPKLTPDKQYRWLETLVGS